MKKKLQAWIFLTYYTIYTSLVKSLWRHIVLFFAYFVIGRYNCSDYFMYWNYLMKNIHHVRKKPTRGIKRVRTKKPDKKSLLVVISYLMKQVGKTIHAQASHVVKHVKKHKRTYLWWLFAWFAVAKMVILMASVMWSISLFSNHASAAFEDPVATCAWVTDVPESECQQLLNLYNSTNGDNWSVVNKVNWWNTWTICTNRWGVSCTDGHVTYLDLGAGNLSGTATLSWLEYLDNLRLNNNKLTSLDLQWLPRLRELWLWTNQLTGIDHLTGLTNLQRAWIGGNPYTYLNFEGMTSMQILDVGGSPLTDIGLSGLTNLTYLNLQNCKLATLPASILWLSSLQSLYLRSNELTALPEELVNLSSVWRFTISYNHINYRTQSSGLNNFIDATLYGDSNRRTNQTLPFSSCEYVDVPQAECEQLVNFYNDTNWANRTNNTNWLLSGTICNNRRGIQCENGHISQINIENNNLAGVATLSWLAYVTKIYLRNNILTWINLIWLPRLTTAYLEYWDLETVTLEWLSLLPEITINDNHLTNISVAGLDSIRTIYLNNNQLSTLNLSGTSNLQTLYANNNKLTSIDLTNCPNLSYLNLSNNLLPNVPESTSELNDLNPNGGLLLSTNCWNISSMSNGLVSFLNTKANSVTWQSSINGACSVSELCGNWSLDDWETCDDAANNGTPWYCNLSCNWTTPVYGCTNSWASNYNPSATIDDNTCTYDSNCGDGHIAANEVCDDGANNGTPWYCNLSCNKILFTNTASIDPKFDTDVPIGFNGSVSISAIQNDGKILVGWDFTSFRGSPSNHLIRLNSDGTKDSSFNIGNWFWLYGSNAYGHINSIFIQDDGKILVGGEFSTYSWTNVTNLIRLNKDGSRDSSFPASYVPNSVVKSIFVQDDGKILVACAYKLSRLNTDGSVDESFTPWIPNDEIYSMAIQDDEKIVIGWRFTTYNQESKRFLVRLETNWAIDSSFTIYWFDYYVKSLAIQNDGKILAGGYWSALGGIIRLNTDWTKDTDFNIWWSGFAASNVIITSILPQDNGRILIWWSFSTYNWIAAQNIVQLTSSGIINSSFDIWDWLDTTPYTLLREKDWTYIIGGEFSMYDWTPAWGIIRLDENGAIHTSFSIWNWFGNYVSVSVIQPDGKILIWWWFTSYNWKSASHIVRLNADGTTDASFVIGDWFTNTSLANIYAPVTAITLLADGKILVGGRFTTYNWQPASHLVRLNTDGSIDDSFTSYWFGSDWDVIYSIIEQDDGKILIGGEFSTYSWATARTIIRLNADWTKDSSFSSNWLYGNQQPTTFAMALQDDGKILVGGRFTNFNTWSWAAANYIARLNSDGTRDVSFNMGNWFDNIVYSLIIQNDGKIVIGGNFNTYKSVTANSIVRLNNNGTRDYSFNPWSPTFYGTVQAIAQQANGKILIWGSIYVYDDHNNTTQTNILRLNNNGTKDTTFNMWLWFDNTVNSITLQSSGSILVWWLFTNYNSVVAGYLVSLYGDSDLVVLPNSTDKETVVTEFTNKWYVESNGDLVWSKSISLIATDGNIPVDLNLKNNDIQLDIPANVQFKEENNVTNYDGIISVPKGKTITTLNDSPVLASFKVGSTSESIRLTWWVASLLTPVPGTDIGTPVQVYYSEDNGVTWYPQTVVRVTENNGEPVAQFTTTHFTDFAVTLWSGDYTWSFVINNDTASTYLPNVTLNISTTPPALQMRFSNDNDTRSDRETYSGTKAWTLLEGSWDKTVYAEFDFDNDSVADVSVSDTILLTDPTYGCMDSGANNYNAEANMDDASCTYTCGNGSTNWPEVCDDGANNGTYWYCNATCDAMTEAVCGNSAIEWTETCDDGWNNWSYGYCNATCDAMGDYCGDGTTNWSETCDDGASNWTPWLCNATCDGTEPDVPVDVRGCTDGNANNYMPEATLDDGSCTYTCGNSVTDPGETCDDGASNGTPWMCNATCDGTEPDLPPGDVYGCTDPTANNYVPEATINDASCTYTCGDWVTNPSETCDDGASNGTSGHCNATCDGQYQYIPTCGDGITEYPETCDDSNTTDGDWCSSSCQVEAGPFVSCANTDIPQAECEALVNLYNNNNGVSWNNQSNWMQSNIICNNRYGVACSEWHVSIIQLTWNNIVWAVDLSGLSHLNSLDFYGNSISSINLAGLTNLVTLSIASNQLSSIDLSGLTKLQVLYVDSNNLSSIDFAGLTWLASVTLGSNNISSINLSGLSNLTYLGIPNNHLSSIDFSPSPLLWQIDLSSNDLSSIDISSLTGLYTVSLGYNQLSSIDLDGLTNLQNLYLKNNQLSSINLAGLTNLYGLNVSNNNLSTIDISWLSGLSSLYIYNNQISWSLDMFCSFTGLQGLVIDHNRFAGDIPLCLKDNLTNMSWGSINYNYLNTSSVTDPDLVTFLNNYFDNSPQGWIVQYIPADLALEGNLLSQTGDTFVLSLGYHNYWPQTVTSGTIYSLMLDWMTISTDTVYTTWTIGKTYGGFWDPCFDQFYNSGSWGYRDLLDLWAQDNKYDNLLAMLSDQFWYTGDQAWAGKYVIDMINNGKEWPITDWYSYFLNNFGKKWLDLATVPGCGTWGIDVYMFHLGDLESWSGWTIIISWAFTEQLASNGRENGFQINSPLTMRVDTVTWNNTLPLRYSKWALSVGYVCGNGTVEWLEQCDDGNDNNNDSCSNTCQIQFSCDSVTDASPSECEALVNLYNSTNGSWWNNTGGWLHGTKVGEWYGITPSKEGHVYSINLAENNLSWSINFSGLTYLEYLYLQNNQLTSIPEHSMDSLSNLKYLELSHNNISTIPDSVFYYLISLTDLNLSDNDITTLPDGVFDSVILHSLNLGSNHLTSLSTTLFNNLTNLRQLSLENNQLTTLPESLVNLTQLESDGWLNVHHNHINYYRLSQPLLDFLDAKNPVSKYGDRRLTQTFTNDYNCGNSICESNGYCALNTTGELNCKYLQKNWLTCTNGCSEKVVTPEMCRGKFSCKNISDSNDCAQYGCLRSWGTCWEPIVAPLTCNAYSTELCPTNYGCRIQAPVMACTWTFDESSITQEQCGTVYSWSWLTEDADSCSADCLTSENTWWQLINSVYGIWTFNWTVFSKSTDTTWAISGDILNYTLHYENNSEISGHYGVMIREYLPSGLGILANLSGRTYVDHEVTYGWTGDLCFQQFMQSTGVYYVLVNDFTQATYGINLYTLLQNFPGLDFTGSEADAWVFFYNTICKKNDATDLQDCFNIIGASQSSPQDAFPQLITVWSGCGVIWAPLEQPYYYHYVGYVGTGQSGDVSFSAQVNGAQTTGLLQNRAEYFPAIIMDTDYESYQNKTEPTEWLQVTLNTEMTQISDLTVTKTLLTTWAHLPWSELQYRIDYANVGNTDLSNVRIYDSALWLSRVTADRTFTGAWYNKEYGVTWDACYADLLNETWVYAQAMDSAINAMYQQYSGQRHNWFTGNTLTSYQMMLFNPWFTGFLVDPWNWRQDLWGDYMMTVMWPNYYPWQTFVEAFSWWMWVDVTTLDPRCGTGWSYYEYTDIGNLAPGESGSIIVTMRVDTWYQAGDTVANVAYGNSKEDQTETGNNMSMVFTTLEAWSTPTTGTIILTGNSNAKVIITTGTTILVDDKLRDEKIPTVTYDTAYKWMWAGATVEWVTSLDFGGSATFDKAIEIDIPVDDSDVQYYVKADHNDGNWLTFNGLTANPDATCSWGLVTSSGDVYSGEQISAVDNEVIIYSCAASSFIAYTLDNHDDEWTWDNEWTWNNWGNVWWWGGGGAAFQKDICKPADCSASYYDRSCGGCPGDALANFLILTTHGVAPAGGMQCTQYSNELNGAYNFAFVNNITTIADCDKVNLNGELLRSHMAKMMSNFAMTTLWLKPNTWTVCIFTDMSKQSDEMKAYAQLACQLGLMWLDTDGKVSKTFNPDEIVTRAQFGTVLSRLLRWAKNNGGTPYYAKHLQALKNVGIMTKITTPNQTELRWFTMLMLQRIMTKAASTINSSDKDRPVRESVQEYFSK